MADTNSTQIRTNQRTPTYWRVSFDNAPLNVMGPEMVQNFQEAIDALEADPHVKVVVFDSTEVASRSSVGQRLTKRIVGYRILDPLSRDEWTRKRTKRPQS